MRALIDDLLKYSRVGMSGTSLQPIDCGATLKVVLSNLEVAVSESGARIDLGQLPEIVADSRQMEQLFQNLLANALKFRGQNAPEIQVSAQRCNAEGTQRPGWEFSVRDNGIGLEPRFAEKIFLIFQRLHQRGEYEGTGIGLAVCKKIVERHGGTIWVDSQPGAGATFRFTIPDQTPSAGEEAGT
jgi:light-regulated signal transduction histidine kinase (bacteriophytochrome)